jgi:hypothetical protein
MHIMVAYFHALAIENLYAIRTGRPRDRSLSPCSVKNFLCFTSSRPIPGLAQPPIQWVSGLNRQGREANHSPATSAEVKKT